jgi:hypothetical protein
MEVLSEHNCEGWLEGYLLTGRHGLFVTYEAFAMVVASMIVQHTKWLEQARDLSWRAPVASLNILLTSTAWRNDHNGFSHQGPGLVDVMLSKRGTVARIYLPPDANCLLSVADHCLRSRNYVNLIVIDKQPQLQWLDMDDAAAHCARGASVWAWAGTDEGGDPDVVLAAAGDIPTMETVAAAWWLRRRIPDLRVRVVNVVDPRAGLQRTGHHHDAVRDDGVERDESVPPRDRGAAARTPRMAPGRRPHRRVRRSDRPSDRLRPRALRRPPGDQELEVDRPVSPGGPPIRGPLRREAPPSPAARCVGGRNDPTARGDGRPYGPHETHALRVDKGAVV